jgi:hypothetical protein
MIDRDPAQKTRHQKRLASVDEAKVTGISASLNDRIIERV